MEFKSALDRRILSRYGQSGEELRKMNTNHCFPVLASEHAKQMLELTQPTAFQEPTLALGDESSAWDEAFAALVRRRSEFIFRVAYSVLRNVQDSEDVMQETFLKLYRARRLEQMKDEKAFLARTAWRIACDRIQRMKAVISDQEIPSVDENPEQAAMLADRKALMHRLIDALPYELRLPLTLSAVQELNSREVADIMQIPEGTVRRRIMEARQILKQKLVALKVGPHAE